MNKKSKNLFPLTPETLVRIYKRDLRTIYKIDGLPDFFASINVALFRYKYVKNFNYVAKKGAYFFRLYVPHIIRSNDLETFFIKEVKFSSLIDINALKVFFKKPNNLFKNKDFAGLPVTAFSRFDVWYSFPDKRLVVTGAALIKEKFVPFLKNL